MIVHCTIEPNRTKTDKSPKTKVFYASFATVLLGDIELIYDNPSSTKMTVTLKRKDNNIPAVP